MDWRSQAACLTVDPELFFPVGNTGPAIAQIARAKEVCARCDVVETCLKWALENGQDAGVWGGMSEDERRSLKRPDAPPERRPRVPPGRHVLPLRTSAPNPDRHRRRPGFGAVLLSSAIVPVSRRR